MTFHHSNVLVRLSCFSFPMCPAVKRKIGHNLLLEVYDNISHRSNKSLAYRCNTSLAHKKVKKPYLISRIDPELLSSLIDALRAAYNDAKHPFIQSKSDIELLEDLIEEFENLDIDNDGYIGQEEFRRKYVAQLTAADRDRNGEVDFVEFATSKAMRKAEAYTSSEMDRDELKFRMTEFKTLDRDNDGHISQAELRQARLNLSGGADQESVFNEMIGTDLNGDDEIDFAEFVRLPGHLVTPGRQEADQRQLQGRSPQVGRRLVKVRLFWVRHGLSCANVMDKCSKGPGQAKQLLPEVEHALRLVSGYETARLNRSFGLKAATATEGDCTVAVEAPNLIPGQVGKRGAIIRVHDLYTDPLLTDCSRRQSVQAGRSFVKWLWRKGIKVHFAGSSFLMRALQTAYGMLRAPCGETEGLDCDSVFVGHGSLLAPIPYMTERSPLGITSFQQDNTPRSFYEQQVMMDKVYSKELEVNSSFAWSWPRYAQHYEKFKAFLAVILAPSISEVASWKVPPTDAFRTALETDLPEEMRPEDRGKEPVTVQWLGGEYVTGNDFNKSEYTSLKAPELNFVIVGHNQMMSEYCLAPDYLPKPNNNAVLEKLFILELPDRAASFQRITMRELGGKCALVMDAPEKEESFSDLATADMTSCSSPFRVADFLELKDGIDIRETRCVQVATESAFPIQPEFL